MSRGVKFTTQEKAVLKQVMDAAWARNRGHKVTARRTTVNNPVTVRYIPYPGGKNWVDKPMVTKEKTFKTQEQMERFLDKLSEEGKLHEVLGVSVEPNPEVLLCPICKKEGALIQLVYSRNLKKWICTRCQSKFKKVH